MGHVPAGPIPTKRSGAHLPGRQYRGAGAGRPTLTQRDLAIAGEALAAHFLVDRGATLVARNLRVGRGEIDLVVAFDQLRIVVEVKTIQTGGLDDPTYSFTERKAQQVRRLAGQIGIRRVDLVAVSLGLSGVDIRWAPQVA